MTKLVRALLPLFAAAVGCLGRAECAGWDGVCAAADAPRAPEVERPPVCDDGNPCTLDAWCMPCELVPAPSLYTCGGYLDARLGTPLASWCPPASRGCEHLDAADGAMCFPAEGDDGEPAPGLCGAGACLAAAG